MNCFIHINVWTGIFGEHLIGLYFLSIRLNAEVYRHFLKKELLVLLQEVPLQLRFKMYFMHDELHIHMRRSNSMRITVRNSNFNVTRFGVMNYKKP